MCGNKIAEGEKFFSVILVILEKFRIFAMRKSPPAVLLVVRTTTRMRMAVSLMRTRTTYLRTRIRTTGRGLTKELEVDTSPIASLLRLRVGYGMCEDSEQRQQHESGKPKNK